EFFIPEGGPLPAGARPEPELMRYQFVSPDFFVTAGTRLIAGRGLTWTDAHAARPVALVSANLASTEWGSAAGALGKRLRSSSSEAWREIVGVVEDVRDDGITQRSPEIVYLPAMTDGIFTMSPLSPNRITFLVR